MTQDVGYKVISVAPQRLTPEAFEPFGTIIEPGSPVFMELDAGRSTVKKFTLEYTEELVPIAELAAHSSYNQVFVSLKGSICLIVAPKSPEGDTGPIDYDKIAAFRIAPGEAVVMHRGTFHMLEAIEPENLFLTVTRSDDERTARAHYTEVDYVSAANSAKRDGIVFKIERSPRD